mgnify:FL=1
MIKIAHGSVHQIPKDMKEVFVASKKLYEIWNNLTPLARNEWICWTISGKKQETREKHINIMCKNLAKGKKRPCCWAGCSHR